MFRIYNRYIGFQISLFIERRKPFLLDFFPGGEACGKWAKLVVPSYSNGSEMSHTKMSDHRDQRLTDPRAKAGFRTIGQRPKILDNRSAIIIFRWTIGPPIMISIGQQVRNTKFRLDNRSAWRLSYSSISIDNRSANPLYF